MAQDDVRRALELLLSDQEVAGRLAAGDFTDVDSLSLSAEERQLVSDAAGDLPDVAGFALGNLSSTEDFFLKFADKWSTDKLSLAIKYTGFTKWG